MKRRKPKRHKYYKEQQEGARAPKYALCPYGLVEIGRMCAWWAGYWDNHKG